MAKFELSYPAKPFWINQAWGIANPSYLPFGFDKHNGIDLQMGTDKLNYCPVKRAVVEDAGYNTSAGWYVRLITTDKYDVLGTSCYVGLMFMHHEKLLCKTGDILEEGDIMGIADSTGFSTGNHVHMSTYRLKKAVNTQDSRLDTDWHTNYTFDPFPFFNGKFAVDAKPHPTPVYNFTKDLYFGVTDDEVRSLQKYLTSHGFTVLPTGQETAYFGALTQKALIAFQKAKGISPSAGYFGKITRAWVANHP